MSIGTGWMINVVTGLPESSPDRNLWSQIYKVQ